MVVGLIRTRILAGTGLALIVLGGWISVRPFLDIVQEVQGHCDYLPCVTRMTAVVLVICGLVIMIGAFAVGMAAGSVQRRRA